MEWPFENYKYTIKFLKLNNNSNLHIYIYTVFNFSVPKPDAFDNPNFPLDPKFQEFVKFHAPRHVHCLSTEILVREAILAGFNIFKVEYFDENENGYVESDNENKKLLASIICIKEVF